MQLAFPAQWFTAYFALSPRIGFLAPVVRSAPERDLRTWHQHRDARTTQLRRPRHQSIVGRRQHVHRIPWPTFVTIANRSSCDHVTRASRF
jgi:hypothetical protein